MDKPPNPKNSKKKSIPKKINSAPKTTKSSKCVSLGPVKNLETHVHRDWWKKIFNAMYLKTDGDVVNDNKITKEEVSQFIDVLHLNPEQKILDLCCGQGRHTLELARQGFKNICGLDQSTYLIRLARSTAQKEKLPVQFKEGDARKLPYPNDSFDFVMILGNSFGYFQSVQDDLKVLKEVVRVLKPYGKIFLDVTDGDFVKSTFQPRSWEWIDKKFFVCRERQLSKDKERLISREVITEVEKGVIVDQFYSERLYSKERMSDLLKLGTFSDVQFLGDFTPNSQRNQDLGMMERRLFVSALTKKEWSPVRQKAKSSVKTVAVIMGDPTKLDIVKPDAVFDDDDLYTINQLKSVLKELKDYNFVYMNKHDNLMSELAKLKGKIDFAFNLCDEGFNNDARLELHVPALLEMVGIPYTGGNPQCLAFCYDKSLVRGIAKEMGINVPQGVLIAQEDLTLGIPFSFPVIIKPNWGDNSIGITQKSVVNSYEELLDTVANIRQKFGYEQPVLIEEFLTGADISVGIIGNLPDSYTVLPITEEDYSDVPPDLPRICGYEVKWLPDSPYSKVKSVPARLSRETESYIVDSCLKLFKRLDCRDYARFDWRLNTQGVPKLLEVNPNPGWCWDGHLAKMARFAGMTYKEMIGAILRAGVERFGVKNGNGNGNGNGVHHENGNGVSHAQPVSNGNISIEPNGTKPLEKTAKTLAP